MKNTNDLTSINPELFEELMQDFCNTTVYPDLKDAYLKIINRKAKVEFDTFEELSDALVKENDRRNKCHLSILLMTEDKEFSYLAREIHNIKFDSSKAFSDFCNSNSLWRKFPSVNFGEVYSFASNVEAGAEVFHKQYGIYIIHITKIA